MDNEKEIPFGAFDSELMHQEITIPEGFEATIEGNKIILKKTESDDVKIRKELIKVFSNREKYLIDQSFGDITVPEILAWLEKQGEHANFLNKIQIGDKVTRNEFGVLVNLSQLKRVAKPADKVEPKFHECEWVVFNNHHDLVFQVEKIENYEYTLRHFLGVSITLPFSHEDIIRLWSIEDAKDGDVLAVNDDNVCIFDGTVEDGIYPFSYCGITKYGFESYDRKLPFSHDRNIHPATKTQRDTLMKSMTDAGYTFNFEKKELKKIDEELTDFEKSLKHIMLETLECGDTRNLKADAELLLRFAQKSIKWNEEDEHLSYWTIHNLTELKNRFGENYGDSGKCIDWIKQLKQRIGG